ncbi:DUF305 domain-containing protein [Mycobacterium ostraviense]|uniref:DUF305 domain-containing protein n=1 Tax=Mycobacterium ostraviense TaxID=2738409 RepID=A0A163YK57_9MYCO|nr:DUF305 domain-containing protein [Mycobacterium ostraviense]KZS60520.1 DUF305 domain-containing protein [Mycobacterium ostraviense]UGT89937.1 DUF305 domain-containing protein [Mycobacterium ostraviense]
MRQRFFTVIAAALAALLTLTACNSSRDQAGSSTTSASHSSGSTLPPGAHNDTDVAFAKDMIPHHQQAIQMSEIMLSKDGVDPRVIRLANQIKTAQGPEVQQLQAWLDQWGQPTMPSHSGMPAMGENSGMMSEQDMQALKNARGVEASTLFLTQMIQHHKGAIMMARNEINSGENPQVIALAQSIVTNQQQEIQTIQDILNSL